jgi:hypothetical protein
MKHAVGMDSCGIKYISSLIKIGTGVEKFKKDTHTRTHTEQGDFISVL